MTDDQVRAQLAAIRECQQGFWNIDAAEGEYLCELVKRMDARTVLEIGTSNGYSGAWFALGLRATGGKLITLEADPGRHSLAQDNFRTLEQAAYVDSRLVNALEEFDRIPGPLDIAFIDAWKPDYVRYWEVVVPKVRQGGLILAHNVQSHAEELREFIDRIHSDPRVRTETISLGPKGLSSSTKL